MATLNYLNAGCGTKYHKDWVNIDMISISKDVKKANLLKKFPFPDNYFDVVYHSQVLEHIPKEKAHYFIEQCYRVLKPNGIIRIVTPNLENIVDEYKRVLNENLTHPNKISNADYDWILLELYDQTVRNYTGGEMAKYLKKTDLINKKYICDRIGFVANDIISKADQPISNFSIRNFIKKLWPQALKIGSFRLSGEVHMWMYDRFSLARLLSDCNFTNISLKNPYISDIPN